MGGVKDKEMRRERDEEIKKRR